MFGAIFAAVKTGIQVVNLIVGVVDQISRERKAEQAKKAAEGKIIGDAYQRASNQAGHEAKKTK